MGTNAAFGGIPACIRADFHANELRMRNLADNSLRQPRGLGRLSRFRCGCRAWGLVRIVHGRDGVLFQLAQALFFLLLLLR